jgi:homoserine O-acetyltransferase
VNNDEANAFSQTFRDVQLTGGAVLAEATIAFRTLGRLNAAGDNAVLVLHGYTTGPQMLEAGVHVAEGSWSELVGPGRAIDTDRYFVVCPNMLGSSFGSTGPGSIDPATGNAYGASFPRITVEDIVATQAMLVDALGIRRLAAAIGPSFGGYQALQWGVMYPDFVERVVAAVSAPYNPASAVNVAPYLETLLGLPEWNAGHPAPGAMLPFLTELRVATLRRYGVDAELAPRFPDAAQREAELLRIAREWARNFDAGSLVVLAQAAADFDLRARLGELRAPLLWVLSRSDAVFAPTLAQELAPLLDAAGTRWSYVELDSDFGHLASGADARLWAEDLRAFMATPPDEWISWGLKQ